MDVIMSYLLHILICALFYIHGGSASGYSQDCDVWYNVSHFIESQPSTNVVCSVNNACTGVDCNGAYTYFGGSFSVVSQTEELCFGVMVEPCHSPVSTFVYIIRPTSSTTFTHSFNQTTHDYPVPGTESRKGPLVFRGVLDVDMSRVDSVYYTNLFKLGLRFRITMTPIRWSHPSNVETLTLVPDMDVSVPDCNPAIHNQELVPHQCTNQTAAPKHQISCRPNVRGQCPDHSFCHPVAGVCQCVDPYEWEHSFTQCVRDRDSTPIFVPDPQPTSEPHTSTVKRVLTVVFGIIGSLAVVGVIFGFLIIKFRRYKARYGDHMLLNSHEDMGSVEPSADDDVPPIDIAE